MDGPDFESLFKKMQCLHGTNAEDVKIIVRYLNFWKDQDGYEMYAAHYLPQLPAEASAQFGYVKEEPEEEPVVEPTVTETVVTEVPASPEEPTVTETTTVSISAPKKKGRPSKK